MDQTIYKKHLILIFSVMIIFLVFYIALIYMIDPLQQFRRAKFYHMAYIDELYQNSGLAKHYPYDTVIIGSSTSENFKPTYIKKTLGFNAIKLTLRGTHSSEEKIILETAIATGKVKNVIYGLDDFSFRYDAPPRNEFPFYLYSLDSANKLKYLFNIGNIYIILKIIMQNKNPSLIGNLDDAYSWDTTVKFSKKNTIRAWELEKKHLTINKNSSFSMMRKTFDKNLLTIIINNPRIQFYLFYPPYSILAYKKMSITEDLMKYLQFKKYIYESTRNLSNVKIYDFQSDFQITHNLNNYKDIIHYSGKINNHIITQLKSDKYLVTKNNITLLSDQLLKQVQIPIYT